MKVDNFDLIKKHINTSEDGSEFYMLQIMRRAKDQVGYDGKRKQTVIKSYFISSPEYLDSKRDEIIGLCEMFNARAYINLNKKSYKQVSLKALEILAGKIAHEEYNIKTLFESAAGQTGACDGNKSWLVDIDTKDMDVVEKWKSIINDAAPVGDKIIDIFPTLHGYHLISKPFNKQVLCFGSQLEQIDVHNNNPTILYVNLKDSENDNESE